MGDDDAEEARFERLYARARETPQPSAWDLVILSLRRAVQDFTSQLPGGRPGGLLCLPHEAAQDEKRQAIEAAPQWVLLEDAAAITEKMAEEQTAQLKLKEQQLEARQHHLPRCSWSLGTLPIRNIAFSSKIGTIA